LEGLDGAGVRCRSRPVGHRQGGVQVRVVPAIQVEALLAHDSLQVVATAGRDPARRLVVGRVLEFETVQAQVVEGPSSVLP